MPWFYVDDGFSDSKPVENLPDHMVKAPLRLAACGLWLLAGSWSAKEETDGLIPASKLRQLGATPTIVRALTEPGPLNASLCEAAAGAESNPDRSQSRSEVGPKLIPIQFKNWPKWQKTRAELQARRLAEAEKKRGQRSKGRNAVTSTETKLSPGDTHGDNTGDTLGDNDNPANPVPRGLPRDAHAGARRPDPTRPDPGNSPPVESSPDVGVERGLTDAVHPSASRLVAALIPDQIPTKVRNALRVQASQLINGDGLDTDTVADALRRWLTKPDAGPGLLPSLAADVIRARAAPATAINGHDDKVSGYLAYANQPRPPELEQ